MRSIAYALITAAFLWGSYLAVSREVGVEWRAFLTALVPGVVGIALVRLARQREAGHVERRSTNLAVLAESLERAAREAERLYQEREQIDVYDLRHRIDERFLEPINAFIEARQSMADAWGLETYAEIMSQFAAGERYLNRVWSASTDGYIDEAHAFLEKARDQFREARQLFARVAEERGVAPSG